MPSNKYTQKLIELILIPDGEFRTVKLEPQQASGATYLHLEDINMSNNHNSRMNC